MSCLKGAKKFLEILAVNAIVWSVIAFVAVPSTQAGPRLLSPATVQQRESAKKKIAIQRLRPSWSANRAKVFSSDNSSFISDLDRNTRSKPAQALDQFFDDRQAVREMRFVYERFVNEKENRRAYDLTTLETERACVDRNTQLRKDFIGGLRSRELTDQRKRLRTNAINGTSQSERRPLEMMGSVAAVYFGEPLELNISDSTRLRAQTKFQDHKAELKMQSPLVNSELQFAQDENRGDGNRPQEKYWLNFNRELPILAISSGISYGSSSNLVTASLARRIAPNLTCTVASSKSTTLLPADLAREQESVSLRYEIRF